ncbi:hypothetical protein [Erwinia billingiae]|uniref:hypothetical protein n=1 Tax=Erwinia billingiae TaxID=182337 RepID=UPI00124402F5|nr:hypothetical protein [Erwinia billingiae]
MKSFKVISLLAILLPLSGCAGRQDYTLSPPASTEWVTIEVKLPEQTEVIPMNVLYRSALCQRKDYDSTTESHVRQERGFNPRAVNMLQKDGGNIWSVRIAVAGGGKCNWELSGIRVGVKIISGNSLINGKNNIALNYVFDFDDQGHSGGFGVGPIKNASGDLVLKNDLFPLITYHRSGKVSIELFSGDYENERWSRHYRVYNVKKISIEPMLYLSKYVSLMYPKPPGKKFTATYFDGMSETIEGNYPDYERLLSMK